MLRDPRSPAALQLFGHAGAPNRHNAAALARRKDVSSRVSELQAEQLAIHQQSVAAAVVNTQVTIEGLIADAEAARIKAMAEKGGSSAAVSALIVKAKLAGMWREKSKQYSTEKATIIVKWPCREEVSDANPAAVKGGDEA